MSQEKASPTFSVSPRLLNRIQSLKIYFVIIGAGVTGLSCAIALRRNGHRVTVIEKNRNITDPQHRRGVRMPPNLTKILINWGLKDRLQAISVKLETIHVVEAYDGELLGVQDCEAELLTETRGEYLFAHLSDLMLLLYDEAIKLGVEIVFGTKATNIQSTKTGDDSGRWTINTDVGQTRCPDVIVGADGFGGLTHRILLDEISDENESNDEDSNAESDDEYNTLFCWLGHGRSVIGYPIGGTEEFALCAYGPDTEGNVVSGITELLNGTEPRLRNLLSPIVSSGTLQRHPVIMGKPLKNWVQAGGLVLVGTGAHPLPPGSMQEKAMDVEDGAILARLFSYLRSPDHIGTLLSAFDELRRGRCEGVMKSEASIMQYKCMPEGEHNARDDTLRAKKAAGIPALQAGGDQEEMQEWREVKEVFGFEVEDNADEWWLIWGAPRFRREVSNEVEAPGTLGWDAQVQHEVNMRSSDKRGHPQ
ncbi:hypothetical protein B0H16DRAFT_1329808 [Mycena metata]|uniref:FAD-binding domain-containing protein n=1 Tax=Mycena metata TaxID=1033252 RepID=A0AAD7HZT9_9AGAR|nr:hypothetical protein B0H16DRAFT_1329808 [Mycena metata]